MRPLLRSILAATDLGSGSDAIVRSAALLAARTGAGLHLLHSRELPWVPSDDVKRGSGFFEQVQAAEEGLRAQAERTMPEGAAGTGAPSLRTEVRVGRPAEEIVRVADDVDLVVTGEHGRSEGKRGAWTMPGSTVERALRSSPAPVLVVGDPPRARR